MDEEPRELTVDRSPTLATRIYGRLFGSWIRYVTILALDLGAISAAFYLGYLIRRGHSAQLRRAVLGLSAVAAGDPTSAAPGVPDPPLVLWTLRALRGDPCHPHLRDRVRRLRHDRLPGRARRASSLRGHPRVPADHEPAWRAAFLAAPDAPVVRQKPRVARRQPRPVSRRRSRPHGRDAPSATSSVRTTRPATSSVSSTTIR